MTESQWECLLSMADCGGSNISVVRAAVAEIELMRAHLQDIAEFRRGPLYTGTLADVLVIEQKARSALIPRKEG